MRAAGGTLPLVAPRLLPAAARDKNSNNPKETNMNSKIVFAALSLAIVLGSASVAAAAAAKKHSEAGKAYGSAAGTTVDPRDAYVAKHAGGTNPTWCDSDPSCNGWGTWLEAVSTGKMRY
jgi:hypothetical protein